MNLSPGAMVAIGLCSLLLVAFPITRGLMVWFAKGPLTAAIKYLSHLLGMVFTAHVIVGKNFAPRRIILPTLAKKGTRVR